MSNHSIENQALKVGSVINLIMAVSGWLAYYHFKNKQLNNSSTLLRTEYSAAIIDGFMSAAIGIALVGISYINLDGNFGFLNYIGDSILVVILVLLLGKEPFTLVRNSFIEIAGGTLQNKTVKLDIEATLNLYLQPDKLLVDSYISKTGSSYLVVAYLNAHSLDVLGFEKTMQTKEKIYKHLKDDYQDVVFEVVLI